MASITRNPFVVKDGRACYTFRMFDMIVDHRSLLYPLPIVLLLTATIVLLVYRERIGDKHAREYRSVVLFSVAASLVSLVVIAVESFL